MSRDEVLADFRSSSEFETYSAMDQAALDALPVAMCLCGADGVILRFNRRAVELWGRVPRPGDPETKFSGGLRLYDCSGVPLLHAASPMAVVLRNAEPAYDKKFVIERADGSRAVVIANIAPLMNAAGRVQGALNCFYGVTADTAVAAESTRRLAGENQENKRRGVAEQIANRLAAIVESSEDAIVSKSINGIVASWNSGAQRLFGYTAEEIIGRSITILIPEGHENEEPALIARIRAGERVEHYETVRRRKDGSLVDISLSLSPVRDGDGHIIGASKIARDIGERKRSESLLAKRADEQAALYEFSASMHRAKSLSELYEASLRALRHALGCDRLSILLYDEFQVMRFAAWEGLSSVYRDAVEGHSPWQPDEKDPHPVLIGDIAASDIPEPLNASIRNEDIRALSFIPIVSDGKLLGKFMTYYETPHVFTADETNLAVTLARQFAFGLERQRSEDELREKEERLRLATQAGRVGVWDWDIAKNRLNWTDSLFPMYGVEKEDFPGTPESIQEMVHPGDRERLEAAIQQALETNTPYELEYRICKPNGQTAWLYTNASLVRDENGPLRLLGATIDITERKQSEAERDLLVAELSHRVKNTLATVVSIAQQSFSRGPSIEEARNSFSGRIRALAQTHSRLAEGNWAGVSFEAMLRDETAPYKREDDVNIRLSGPSIVVNARCAVVLGMAVHELVTNAAKYGALSTKDGVVSVAWNMTCERELCIRWREQGGPPVGKPSRSGFGSLLLERALASDLKGQVTMDFAEQGLNCDIVLPMDAHAPG